MSEHFNVTHFFVLLSLLAATVAVIAARPAAPENLILLSLTVGAAGAAGIFFYRMLAPLVAPHVDIDREPLSERLRADLEREKALTLRSIKELEFDRAMGKLSTRDFDEMAARLRARALGIMKQLDAGTSEYRAQIETELAARLGSAGKRNLPASAKGYGGGAEAFREGGQVGRVANRGSALGKQRASCTCGTANDHDARFCKSCGKPLVQA